MDQSHLYTIIQLARLYGIAETLHPLRRRTNADVTLLILGWADAYEQSSDQDLSDFFAQAVAREYED